MATECEEIAASMAGLGDAMARAKRSAPELPTFDCALRWVRQRMPGESETVISNVAWAIYRARRAA